MNDPNPTPDPRFLARTTGLRVDLGGPAPTDPKGLTGDQRRALARSLSGAFAQWVEMLADNRGLTPSEIKAGVAAIVCPGSGMTAA